MMSADQEAVHVLMKRALEDHASSSPSVTGPLFISTHQKTRKWKAQPSRTFLLSSPTYFHCSFCCSSDNWRENRVAGTKLEMWRKWKGLETRKGGISWVLVTLPNVSGFRKNNSNKSQVDILWIWIHKYSSMFLFFSCPLFIAILWHG